MWCMCVWEGCGFGHFAIYDHIRLTEKYASSAFGVIHDNMLYNFYNLCGKKMVKYVFYNISLYHC